ncbi:hypothetical protein RISK_003363 [Rhodopirellula islandica]|uniref:Uncharacterized protein n=1 Tax=Rhodopirellula islandica TaxID=595434 RepID=A0A0J1BE05_RHOIS|nr:hypothetical protein RISK_003363 [Rhodopirellula islandica]
MHPDEVQHNSNNMISEAQHRTLAKAGDCERGIGRVDERLKQTMGGH